MAYAGEYEDKGGGSYPDQDPSNPPPGYQWDARTGSFVPIAQSGNFFDVNAPTFVNTVPPPAYTPGQPGSYQPGSPNDPNRDEGPGPTPSPAPGPIGVPTSGFGAAPAPYASNPDAPAYAPMPTYVPPTWTGGDFVNPTEEDLYNSPGYKARLDRRLKGESRRFASQGTILNGGTLGALDRSAQEYATGEYQTLRNNSYDAYVQKYRQFTDAAGMDLGARTVNANENQNTFMNRTQAYGAGNARTLTDYLTNLTAKRNSELDYWNRLQDVSGTGASLADRSR